jgi:hypothetical protein
MKNFMSWLMAWVTRGPTMIRELRLEIRARQIRRVMIVPPPLPKMDLAER